MSGLVAIGWTATASAINDCGELTNAYGPFDYRIADKGTKHLVEGAHFTPSIETLQHGESGSLGAELDYTLRVFPNHPRALLALVKLGARDKTERPDTTMPIECYLERATRFTPDDPGVRVVYGIYLSKKGDRRGAMRELDVARDGIEQLGGNANLSYNLGLVYFELGEHDKALEQAQQAYALGFPLPGLRKKLKGVGKWQD